jgi:hypothetical protein
MNIMKEMLMKMFKSRKFWYGFSIIMVIIFSDKMGISDVKMNTLCMVGVAMIIGQGIADIACMKKDCKK